MNNFKINKLRDNSGFWVSKSIDDVDVFVGGISAWQDKIVVTYKDKGKIEKGWGSALREVHLFNDLPEGKEFITHDDGMCLYAFADKDGVIHLGRMIGVEANDLLTIDPKTEDPVFEAKLSRIA